MKSSFAVIVVALAVAAAACSSGNPIATVGGEKITDEQVNGFHAGGVAGSRFGCTLDFLIASELLVEAARTELGITVTGSEIDSMLESTPSHRAAAMSALRAGGAYTDDGIRAHARLWALIDRVAETRGGSAGDVSVVEEWISGLGDSGGLREVVVDPLFGSWSGELSADEVCGGVVARIGDVGITEGEVLALRNPGSPATAEEFNQELQFLISYQLYHQEATEQFDITVTEEDVDAFLSSPPPHRIEDLIDFQTLQQFSREAMRVQARRWILADEVVAALVRENTELLDAIAASTGLGVDEVAADPVAFLQLGQASGVFNTWTTEIARAGGFTEVTVDPTVGSWDPVFRQLIPAGG